MRQRHVHVHVLVGRGPGVVQIVQIAIVDDNEPASHSREGCGWGVLDGWWRKKKRNAPRHVMICAVRCSTAPAAVGGE